MVASIAVRVILAANPINRHLLRLPLLTSFSHAALPHMRVPRRCLRLLGEARENEGDRQLPNHLITSALISFPCTDILTVPRHPKVACLFAASSVLKWFPIHGPRDDS